MIKKVISGGQTGVDIAALKVAKQLGIPTGGTAPKGYLTEAGPNLELKEIYGLTEHPLEDYRFRTLKNIKDSDFTLILYKNVNSPGTKMTLEYCSMYKKPYNSIKVMSSALLTAEYIADIIKDVGTLNVAGNRESKSPIEQAASYILTLIFTYTNFNILRKKDDFDSVFKRYDYLKDFLGLSSDTMF